MKIAYVLGAFPSNSETFIINQVVGVAAEGHRVHILTTCRDKATYIPHVVEEHGLMRRTISLSPSGNSLVKLLKTTKLLLRYGWRAPVVTMKTLGLVLSGRVKGPLRFMHAALVLIRCRSRRYDVIHAQFGTYGMLALDLVTVGAIQGPVVVSFRGYDTNRVLAGPMGERNKLFNRVKLFLPVSENIGKRLRESGCCENKVVVHHSCIHLEKFMFEKRGYRPDGPVKIITVARLVEKKGISYAIEAVANILRSGLLVEYSIVGEGPLRAELENSIVALGVTSQVSMKGWCDHDTVIRIMQHSHLLVAPSVSAEDGDEEGIPNVIKEAMAVGLPVVTTYHGGIGELIEDGVSGYLVPERDVGQLADRLTILIDHPEMWDTIGQAGRRKVEREYDCASLSQELIGLYQTLSDSR
jgi:colanic acid/amylovoran biosynthesis glycosyltransferase